MVCYYCKQKTQVINSRLKNRSNSIWRRRKCLNCGQIFTTTEVAELNYLFMVENTTGILEPFNRDKLFLSIFACLNHSKDPVGSAKSLTDTLMSKLLLSDYPPKLTTDHISSLAYPIIARFDKFAAEKYIRSH